MYSVGAASEFFIERERNKEGDSKKGTKYKNTKEIKQNEKRERTRKCMGHVTEEGRAKKEQQKIKKNKMYRKRRETGKLI
jgi:hypothetical protein